LEIPCNQRHEIKLPRRRIAEDVVIKHRKIHVKKIHVTEDSSRCIVIKHFGSPPVVRGGKGYT
jgi:hypothetical protein